MSPASPTPDDPGRTTHVHAWQGYVFGFDGEHPVAEQSCACGATRAIRAWEATWEPGGPPAPHPARRPLAARPPDDAAG